MKSRNQQFKLYTSVIAVLLVAVSTAQLSSIVLSNGAVVYAYSNSQAQSLSNECDVIDSTGVSNCQNSGPQTQADGTASSPITSQVSNFGQQETQGPPSQEPPAVRVILTVIKIVECEGIGAGECPDASDFTMTVEGANPSEPSFPGSTTGTKINIDANTPYSVGESLTSPPVPDVEVKDTTFSEQCSGQVAEGVTETCTITNLVGHKSGS